MERTSETPDRHGLMELRITKLRVFGWRAVFEGGGCE